MSDSDIDPFDMDRREAEMNNLLWRCMAAPVPHLSPDFDQILSRELRRRSQPSKQFGQILLAGYGAVSVAISMVVMRGQGLGWVTTAVMTLAPLAMFELARRLRRRQWGMAAK
jgi:hypothetical protein